MNEVEDLVALCKEVAKDKKALDAIQIGRSSATYKLVHGLGKTFKDSTLQILRSQPFSLNIDESTSSANKKILAVMVNYFNLDREEMVMEHLSAIELIKVDTDTLFNALVELFKEYDLSWDMLVSILMDSCAVMRGSKNGLEVRIRNELAPHLLDIDGDVCHHIHNASKKLCGPFSNWLESLFTDLHNDLKWSPDLREFLAEISAILDVKFTMPERHISHRWLSAYDITLDTLRMWDCHKVFYYGFMSKDDQKNYRDVVEGLLRYCPDEDKAKIKDVWKNVSAKNLTPDGKERKRRIIKKLLHCEKQTLLTLNFYKSVLPLLKSYVCLFQSSTPLVHKLYDKQETLMRQFLSNFVRQDKIKSGGGLASQELSKDEGQFMEKNAIFYGGKLVSSTKSFFN